MRLEWAVDSSDGSELAIVPFLYLPSDRSRRLCKGDADSSLVSLAPPRTPPLELLSTEHRILNCI